MAAKRTFGPYNQPVCFRMSYLHVMHGKYLFNLRHIMAFVMCPFL